MSFNFLYRFIILIIFLSKWDGDCVKPKFLLIGIR